QSSIFNVNVLRKMINNFNSNFSSSLNLINFLDNYGIDIDRFYSRYSFYKLLFQTGKKKNYKVKNKKELAQSLRKFSKINSKRLLDFSEKLLTENLNFSLFSKNEILMRSEEHTSELQSRFDL